MATPERADAMVSSFDSARGLAAAGNDGGAQVKAAKKSKRLNHKKRFSLLIVRGDGARIVRISFPKKIPAMIFVGVGVFASVLAVLIGDWWHVRQRIRDSASLYRQIDEQRATIEGMNRRVAQLHQEVSGWRDVHGRIWEAFGPDIAPKKSGIGGRATPPDRPAGAQSPIAQLDSLADNVAEEGESLRALDKLMTRARKAFASLPSRWPVRGAVNSEFGNRPSPWTKTTEFHAGLDIGADQGTIVRAPAPGTVVLAGPHAEYGLAVIVDHGQDVKSLYGHLSKILVKPGQTVERGMEIARSGNTGRSSGPHLHYEVMVKGQPVNPRAYLWD